MAMRLILLSFSMLLLATGCRSAPISVLMLDQPEMAAGQEHRVLKNEISSKTVRQVAFFEVQETKSDDQESNSSSGELAPRPGLESDVPPSDSFINSGAAGTLESIESLALAINPAIQQAQAELDALRGKRVQVGLRPNPIAGISGDDINEDGSAGRYGVYFGNTIIRGNKLGLARKTVCAEINAQTVVLAELQQRLITDVRMRYYVLLVAIEKERLAAQFVELSQNAVDTTQQLLRAQELAKTALLQSELELKRAAVTLRRASNDVDAARRNLAVFIDEDDLPFAEFTGSLTPQVELVDIEQTFDRVLQESPEIAKLTAQTEIARRNLARQCAGSVPDLTWQTGLAYDTASNDIVTSFQVGVPITKFNRNQGAIAQARNQVVANEKMVDVKVLQLRQRLVSAYQSYSDAKIQTDAFEDEILPKAQETLDLVMLGYREGEVSFLELLTAQRTYFEINLENIQQQKQMWQQRIKIEGMLLSGNLD